MAWMKAELNRIPMTWSGAGGGRGKAGEGAASSCGEGGKKERKLLQVFAWHLCTDLTTAS